jgi:hypothetical protein
MGTPEFGQPYPNLPTEIVPAGTEEVWEIANRTGDTHPIHFHLVNVQVLSRQTFDEEHYTGGAPTLTGPAVAPDNNELGWKETVRMNPGEVTRVWMRFNLPVVPFTVPASPRLANEFGIHGAEYDAMPAVNPRSGTNRVRTSGSSWEGPGGHQLNRGRPLCDDAAVRRPGRRG